MARIPTVLGPHDLPLPELQAARMDGDLFELHGAFVPIDVPDGPAIRARIVAVGADPTFIIERRCAAWVHDAVAAPPRTRQFCTPVTSRTGSRGTARGAPRGIRELILTPDEVIDLDGVLCTSRARTALDMLRDPKEPDAEQIITRLVEGDKEIVESLWARTQRGVRLPHRALALFRLHRMPATARPSR
jgi:hypothetical protein